MSSSIISSIYHHQQSKGTCCLEKQKGIKPKMNGLKEFGSLASSQCCKLKYILSFNIHHFHKRSSHLYNWTLNQIYISFQAVRKIDIWIRSQIGINLKHPYYLQLQLISHCLSNLVPKYPFNLLEEIF
jgi:hypothetical protein